MLSRSISTAHLSSLSHFSPVFSSGENNLQFCVLHLACVLQLQKWRAQVVIIGLTELVVPLLIIISLAELVVAFFGDDTLTRRRVTTKLAQRQFTSFCAQTFAAVVSDMARQRIKIDTSEILADPALHSSMIPDDSDGVRGTGGAHELAETQVPEASQSDWKADARAASEDSAGLGRGEVSSNATPESGAPKWTGEKDSLPEVAEESLSISSADEDTSSRDTGRSAASEWRSRTLRRHPDLVGSSCQSHTGSTDSEIVCCDCP